MLTSYNSDASMMRAALGLAKRAWGKTNPNPMVGSVIVKDGKIVGRGYHRKAGEAHAEINALCDAGENAKDSALYVTLEPCSTTGRTPPCTEAIIAAGVKKVVIGSLDPNPKHAGAAVNLLERAGIEVVSGVEAEKCDRLNEAFFKWIVTGRPFVLLKMAMTLDGKIATSEGLSKWITGPFARRRVQKLRQWSDAIVVGGGTARHDRPSLNVREPSGWPCQPRRIIISSTLSSKDALELTPEGREPEVFSLPDKASWDAMFVRLGAEDVVAVLLEGGGELAASALNAGVVDKAEFHIAPKILGGRNSRAVVGGPNPMSLAEAHGFSDLSVRRLGDDIAVSGYIK